MPAARAGVIESTISLVLPALGAFSRSVSSLRGPRIRALPLDTREGYRAPQARPAQQLDLLDGIWSALVQTARKAARAASKSLGRPALAKLFELDLLYGRPAKKKEEKVA